MPTVPGLTPDQAPQGFLPEKHLDVPVDAFGGAIGHALQSFGSEIEQGSDRIWQRAVEMQGLKNETEAKEADAQYMMKSGLLHADFINKEGLNAGPEALAKHIQELQDLRTSIRGSLSNPAAQRMYDASSLGFMGRNIFNAAGHSGQQVKVAANKADDAQSDLVKSNMYNNPDDTAGASAAYETIRNNVVSKARRNGLYDESKPDGGPVVQDMLKNELSEATGQRILGVAKKNAIKAQGMLDFATAHGMDAGIAQKLQNSIDREFTEQGAQYITNKLLINRRNGGDENKPLQDYETEAEEMARGMPARDMDQFVSAVRRKMQIEYNHQTAIERDADNMNWRTVTGAIDQANQEGQKPITRGQLEAINPAVRPALDALKRNPQMQIKIDQMLDRNAKGVSITPNDANRMEFWKWKNMATGTEDAQSAFLAHTFTQDFDGGKFTPTQLGELQNLQNRKNHEAYQRTVADPRIQRAMRILEPEISALGIRRGKPDSDENARAVAFRGALQDQLVQWQQDPANKGKMPDQEQLKTIFNQLVAEHVTSPGLFWDTKERVFEEAVPEERAKAIKAEYMAAHEGLPPTENQIARIHRWQQFNKYYKGAKKASE